MDAKKFEERLKDRAIVKVEIEVDGDMMAVEFRHPTPERIFSAGGEAFGALVIGGGMTKPADIPLAEQLEAFASMRRICAAFYIEPNLEGGRADVLSPEEVSAFALAILEAAGLAGGEREDAERFPDTDKVEG